LHSISIYTLKANRAAVEQIGKDFMIRFNAGNACPDGSTLGVSPVLSSRL
jgi:hypothetical protein